jgi:hypothetical protein
MYKVQFTTFIKGRQKVIETMTLDKADHITTSTIVTMAKQLQGHFEKPVLWFCYEMDEGQ